MNLKVFLGLPELALVVLKGQPGVAFVVKQAFDEL